MTLHWLMPIAVSAGLLAAAGGCSQFPDEGIGRFAAVPTPVRDRAGRERLRYVAWPQACMTWEPPRDPPLGDGLPAGCANDYNLLQMTERESDLLRGRGLGPAPAKPSARAAQRYIYGTEGSLGAGISDPGGNIGPTADDNAQAAGSSRPAAAPAAPAAAAGAATARR